MTPAIEGFSAAALLSGQPWAIDAKHAPTVHRALLASEKTLVDLQARGAADDLGTQWRPWVQSGGTVVIPVTGVLLDMPIKAGSMATGYGYIIDALDRALVDDSVDRVVLHLASPGGSVSRLMEVAETVSLLADAKEVIADVRSMAASAAYIMSAGASRIEVAPGAIVGSVGVLTDVISLKRAFDSAGMDIEVVHAGDGKDRVHPASPVDDDKVADAQAVVDEYYGLAVQAVSRGRSMPESRVREIGARVFVGEAAVGVGLADAVSVFAVTKRDEDMSKKDNATEAPMVEASLDEAAIRAEAEKKGREEGRREVHETLASILAMDAVASELSAAPVARAALKLLAEGHRLETVQAVVDASASVKASMAEAEEVPAGASALNARMAAEENVPASPETGGDGVSDEDRVQATLARIKLHAGVR